MTRSLLGGLVALLGVTATACGASESRKPASASTGGAGAGGVSGGGGMGGTGGASQPVPLEQLPTALASALCDNIGSCCARAGFAFNADACGSYGMKLAASYAALDATKIGYDPNAAGACVSELAQAAKACVVPEETSSFASDCSRMFVGKVPQGEPCESLAECAPVGGAGADCLPASGDGSATCGLAPVRVATGAACSETRLLSGVTCDAGSGGAGGMAATQPGVCYASDGLECEASAAGGHACAPLPIQGQPCECACAGGAYCDGVTARCTEQTASGPCDTSNDACLPTAYCDEATDHCRAKIADGESCTAAATCQSGGCYQGVCGPELVATESLCAKGP